MESFTGTLEEAEEQARAFIRAHPGNPGGYAFYMTVALSAGRIDQALAVFQAAKAQNALSPTLLGQAGQAAALNGDMAHAAELLAQAFAQGVEDAELQRYAAAAYLSLGKLEEAEAAARQAQRLAPEEPAYKAALAEILSAQRRYGDVISLTGLGARLARHLGPEFALRRALALAHLGCWDGFDEAAAVAETFSCQHPLRSQWLFALAYHPTAAAADIKAAYARWGAEVTAARGGALPPGDGSFAGRDANRIGFLVGDFAQGSLMSFLRGPAKGLCAAGYSLFAYVTRPFRDQVSAQAALDFAGVRPVHALNDDAVAALVAEDRVQVLIDMAALSAGGRPGLFARRAAPIQIAWHGTGFTTGLPAMDGYLGDHALLPPEAEAAMTEPQLLRLATGAHAWIPPAAAPPPSPREGGNVVFCCLARPMRFNARVFDCWAEILKRVPGSRLILNAIGLGTASHRDWVAGPLHAALGRHGVGAERVTLMEEGPVWATYQAADIALDPFPHGAATTALDALWMGLPVVTLAARPPAGRWGASILTAIGRTEWIAGTEADYVACAVALAADRQERAAVRRGMRDQMMASAVCDEKAFAASFAVAIAATWPGYAGQAA